MWKSVSGKILSFSLACAAALALWAFWLEPASLYNEDYELALPSWPASCGGMRIAALADLHVGSPFNDIHKLEKIVEMTNAARPDLILLLGDYVVEGVLGGSYVIPEAIAEKLRGLSAPLGVFAVLGNHDHTNNARRIEKAFKTVGISFLEDAATLLSWKQCKFWLVGLSDFLKGPRRYRDALAKVADGEAALAFTHNPDAFPLLPSTLSLIVAGHTHGGQVRFPMIGPMIVPSRYGRRFAAGHIVEGQRHFFVSPGLGTSILPVRFLVPPEISVLTLRSTQAGRELDSRISRPSTTLATRQN